MPAYPEDFIGPLPKKQCSTCKYWFELGVMPKATLGKYGRRSTCLECSAKFSKKWRASGSDKAIRHNQAARDRMHETKDARKIYMSEHRKKSPARRMLIASRSRAKSSGLAFDLEESDITVPDVCPVLGLPMFDGTTKNGSFAGGPNSPSLDRLDPKLGYTRGNVAVISWRANDVKGNATLEELEAVVSWMKFQIAARDQSQQAA